MRALETAVAAAALLSFALPAAAIQIIASPQNTAGGLRHNTFHTADTGGGQGGTVLAWFDLDTTLGAANDYDPITGDLTAGFSIFSDETLTTAIGTAVATGNVSAAALSDATQNNVVIGSLTWTFDLGLDVTSDLYAYIEASFGAEADDIWTDVTTTDFADVQYATSPQGRTANTFVGGELTLWGADGTFIGSNLLGGPGGKGGFGTSSTLGVDLVLAVPEPGTATLVILGLAGLATRRRRAA